ALTILRDNDIYLVSDIDFFGGKFKEFFDNLAYNNKVILIGEFENSELQDAIIILDKLGIDFTGALWTELKNNIELQNQIIACSEGNGDHAGEMVEELLIRSTLKKHLEGFQKFYHALEKAQTSVADFVRRGFRKFLP
ncbi:hypothetical protein, partial [Piscirickettsia litoralis]|uniref:hypothetical protein n=1 Tax=Piscirickettsia litoralis TaxID=1891921 RepID=UPI0013019727